MKIYEWLYRALVTNIDYTIQISELIYYWIISIALLYIAYKTYKNSFKKEAILIAQLSYYDDDFNNDNLYLEIYNHGNDVAKNIVLSYYDDNFVNVNNSIFNNNLGFIKPNTSKKIHVGYSYNKQISIFGKEFLKQDLIDKEIKFNIKYNKSESKDFTLNTSFLSSLKSIYISTEKEDNTSKKLKEINKTLQEINKNIKIDQD